MLYFLVLFIVTVTAINGATTDVQDYGADKIINLLLQKMNVPAKEDNQKTSSEDISGLGKSDSDNTSHYGSLKSHEIIDLIQQATQDFKKNPLQHANSEKTGHRGQTDSDHNSDDKYNEHVLKELLSSVNGGGVKSASYKSSNKRLTPNRLIDWNFERQNDEKHEALANIDDYSKIYIILNPENIQKSNNKNSLNDLVSKILAMSSPSSQREERGTHNRYNGFPQQANIFAERRAKRDSREMFGAKESDEEYKPKRSRAEHGGGGSRTAIPYIGNRGDIYERNN